MNASTENNRPSAPGIVLSVGQCGFDNGQMRELIRSLDPALELRVADDVEETIDQLASAQGLIRLVLVNRVLDVDGSSGIDLIRKIRASADRFGNIPLMLVSDREPAQAQAIAEGAMPGFGKSALRSAQTRDRVRQAIESGG
ncbi:hypothetical protein GC170_02980 [bacterium]|nr:hypothetical protein [bacterium]